MRLYLSSFKFGNNINELKNLVGRGDSAVIILNARDHKESENRQRFLAWEIETLKGIGINAEELDLRKYFGNEKDLEGLLNKKNLVWIEGGNTFLMRRAMRQSGFDDIIKRLLKEDKIVYAGFSAACVVLQKDLHGLDIVDDPNIVADGYDKNIIWDGLGLLDFNLAVHYKSDHPESVMIDREVEYCEENNIPYKTLKDGEVLIICGNNSKIVS